MGSVTARSAVVARSNSATATEEMLAGGKVTGGAVNASGATS